ncbi:signal peptidase II [Solicola gregarius]|uniref:Lipoprotein signal peptidase n=1 Tax=Solicola gregarius TaxID=2908642 RepID=A0AA46THQ0_9ACTN|nr:signal peptidase II [Solicola gregarius]UYM05345.1 signal peptidase II [Solicola gregarius]
MQAARGTPLSSTSGDDTTAGRPRGRSRRLVLFATVAVIAYALDVVTKIIAVARLEGPPVETVTVIPNVLDLTLVRNSGAAFGIATGFTAVLTAIAVGVCIVVVRMAGKLRDPIWAIALGLLLGGALGNLTDRFARSPGPLRGHVVDFLALPHWPVFNLADCCVTVAAVLIALQSFRGIGLDGRRVNRDPERDE